MSQTGQRVGIFVDMSNIIALARGEGFKIDFERLRAFIAADRQIVRSIVYLVKLDEKADLDSFVYVLRNIGYEVRMKDAKRYYNGRSKGNWDVALAVDAVAIADKVDTVCLVSGDGDFVPLLNYLKAKGVRTEVYAIKGGGISQDIVVACDEFFEITRALSKQDKESK